ncbi:MAG TPA: hypothetical protein VH280_13820 [Verrucomicrobiae bacterium]|jgi:hypothetical protein|nr:hypothetical protein [Verrucomicrobiae bacterium]
MSNYFWSGLHSHRRRYRIPAANRHGIVVLSLAWSPWPGKSGGRNSEKIGGGNLG